MRRFLRFLDLHFEETLVLCLLVFLVLAVNLEVFRRYVLNASGSYIEEIARFTSIWIVYIGVPYAIRTRRHIICDVIPASFPPSARASISLVGTLFFLLAALLFLRGSVDLVRMQMVMDKRTEAMHVPMWWFTSVMIVSAALSAVRLAQAVAADLRALAKGRSAAN